MANFLIVNSTFSRFLLFFPLLIVKVSARVLPLQMASLVSKGIIVLKPENVAELVFFIRGEKVLLDADLAMLYGVEPRVLNQAVARNRKRFPADFMFQVSASEYDALTSQIVISDKDDARPLFSSHLVPLLAFACGRNHVAAPG